MDAQSLIAFGVAVLGGGGAVALINAIANWRKTAAESGLIRADTNKIEVTGNIRLLKGVSETAIDIAEDLRKDIDKLQDKLERLGERYREVIEENTRLRI